MLKPEHELDPTEEVIIRVNPDNLVIDVTSPEYKAEYERGLRTLTDRYMEEIEKAVAAGELDVPIEPESATAFTPELAKRKLAHRSAIHDLMLHSFLGGFGMRGVDGAVFHGVPVRFVADEGIEFGKHRIEAEDPDAQMARFRELM